MSAKKTVRSFRKRAETGHPFPAVTAYDAVTAALAEEAGIPLILVGDSVGMALLGYNSTLPVTLDDIIHHAAAVRRGAPDAFIVADMPFMTYETSSRDAMLNAARALREGRTDAVKLEGGREMAATISALVSTGIPVLAHIGLLPQQVLTKGGYFLRGKTPEDIEELLSDAQAVVNAGAFAVVLEGVIPDVAALITRRIEIPTIGIASGSDCDAQIQVVNDLTGYSMRPFPKHAKNYLDMTGAVRSALAQYRADVEAGQ